MKSHEQAIEFAKKMNQEFGDEIVAYSNLRHVDISAKGLSKATGVDYVRSYIILILIKYTV